MVKNKGQVGPIIRAALAMENQKAEYIGDLSSATRSALWEHYYMKDDEIQSVPKRRLRRVTKKEMIVRTLKDQKDHEGVLSLQELSSLTGMTTHDISGHLTHLVNEGKVVRRGRGLFALAIPVEGRDHKIELKNLVKSVARRTPKAAPLAEAPFEQKLVIKKEDDAESRRMMIDFLSDALNSCSNVELVIKCTKDLNGKAGHTTVELKAR